MSDKEEEWNLDLCLGTSSTSIPRQNELDLPQMSSNFIRSRQFFPQIGNREIGESSSSTRRRVEISSGGEESYSVPHDLLMQIATEFPVKSLLRFLTVSRLWESTIRSRDFAELYLCKSLARSPERQGLVLTFVCSSKCFVFSSSSTRPEEEETSKSSSVVASYNMMCDSPSYVSVSPSTHGLICYGPTSRLVVYNPCTRGSVFLPRINLRRGLRIDQYVGYDPVDSVYKVVCVVKARPVMASQHGLAEEVRVLTLGNDELSWRMVENVPHHSPTSDEIYIDGVLYYGAFTGADLTEPSVMRFDVRSEAFDLIRGPENADVDFLTSSSKLTSYEGKVAIISFEDDANVRVVLWVLEDEGNAEWTRTSFVLPSLFGFTTDLHLQLFGGTNAGEIILAPAFVRSSTFRVLYYDPRKDRFRKIEIEGITDCSSVPHEVVNWWFCRTVSVFPGQIENLMFLKRD